MTEYKEDDEAITDPFTESTLQRMINAVGLNWQIEDSSVIPTGKETVYAMTVRDSDNKQQEAILKASNSSTIETFRHEPNIIRHVEQHTTIPTPSVIARMLNPTDLPAPFFIMEHLSSPSPHEIENRLGTERGTFNIDDLGRISRQVGNHLGQLHELGPLSDVGKLAIEDEEFVVWDVESSWADWVRQQIEAERVPLHALKEQEDRILEYCEEMISELPEVDPVPCHYDFHPGNFLVDPETNVITSVLDWGDTHALHHEYELALTEHHLTDWATYTSGRRTVVRKNLYDGYETHRSLTRDDGFEQRRRFYLAASAAGALSLVPPRSEETQRELLEHFWKFFDRLLDDWEREKEKRKTTGHSQSENEVLANETAEVEASFDEIKKGEDISNIINKTNGPAKVIDMKNYTADEVEELFEKADADLTTFIENFDGDGIGASSQSTDDVNELLEKATDPKSPKNVNGAPNKESEQRSNDSEESGQSNVHTGVSEEDTTKKGSDQCTAEDASDEDESMNRRTDEQ